MPERVASLPSAAQANAVVGPARVNQLEMSVNVAALG
jgi:hypothetical protein